VSEVDIEEMFTIADQDKDGRICYKVSQSISSSDTLYLIRTYSDLIPLQYIFQFNRLTQYITNNIFLKNDDFLCLLLIFVHSHHFFILFRYLFIPLSDTVEMSLIFSQHLL
jgi:hypothetical protein